MIGAIVFARLSSSRLPNKVMIEVQGKPILEHIIERVARSKYLQKIVLATTTNPVDGMIAKLGSELGIATYRGSELDVLDRCYQAAKNFSLDPVVRITADDPFKDPEIIDMAIEIYLRDSSKYDIVCNTLEPTFPEGLDVEVISFKALERAWKESSNIDDRQHVTKYLLDNPKKFRIFNFKNSEFLSNIRLTLDTKEDLVVVKSIYDALYPKSTHISWKDVIAYLKSNPSLLETNKNVKKSSRYEHLDKR